MTNEGRRSRIPRTRRGRCPHRPFAQKTDKPNLLRLVRSEVHFWIVGAAQEVIYGNLVEVRDADEGSGGNIDIAALVIAVDPLAAREDQPHLGLGKVLIFPKVADTGVEGHGSCPPFLRNMFIIL